MRKFLICTLLVLLTVSGTATIAGPTQDILPFPVYAQLLHGAGVSAVA